MVLIFTSAAICGNCTNAAAVSSTEATADSGQSTSSIGSSGESSTSSSVQGSPSTQGGDASSTSQGATTSTSSSETGSPTITLAVYEGPNYSPADNIYYFRVEATVTGTPKPSIAWSRDNSNSAWGNKKAQVNLNPGETYTLTATAKNSVGTASANIILTAPASSSSSDSVNHTPDVADINVPGGILNADTVYVVSAASSDSDGDTLTYAWSSTGGTWVDPNINPAQWKSPAAAGDYTIQIKVTDGKGGETTKTKTVSVGPAVVNLNVPKVITEGGYIESGGKINTGGGLFAGDSAAGSGYIGNKPVRGYVSFDITGLNGKIIDQAILTFNINSIYGVPDPAFGGIWVGVVDWGAEALVLTDFGLPQVGIQLFDMSGGGNITCDTATLKTQLQNAINDGKSRFQIRISHPGIASNLNNTWDGWSYLQAGVNLNINYH